LRAVGHDEGCWQLASGRLGLVQWVGARQVFDKMAESLSGRLRWRAELARCVGVGNALLK